MSGLVLDTHAIIWYLEKSSHLLEPARTAIKDTLKKGHRLRISPVSLAEIVYLEEKGRIAAGTLNRVLAEITRVGSGMIEAPFSAQCAKAMTRIPRDVVPDFPDRMIAATAIHLGLPLVTADRQIQNSGIVTVW